MIYACKMEQKDNSENKTVQFGTMFDMVKHGMTNAEHFYSEIEPASYKDMSAEIDRLEKSLVWAELSLANCSWETGDSNRKKVAEIKAQIAPLSDELKVSANEV